MIALFLWRRYWYLTDNVCISCCIIFMMKPAISLLLVIICFNCSAQTERSLLKFCPLALIDDGSFPTIQAGIEFKLSGRITLYNEAGIKYRNRYFDTQDSVIAGSGGFKVKTEIRYYLKKRRQSLFDDYYYAANIFYNQDQHSTTIFYYGKNDSTVRLTDEFGVKKKVWGINIVYGHQKTWGKRWLTDLYAGLGFRYRTILTANKEYNKVVDRLVGYRHPNLPDISQQIEADEKNGSLPNVTMGIRICYQL